LKLGMSMGRPGNDVMMACFWSASMSTRMMYCNVAHREPYLRLHVCYTITRNSAK
jgi:hypothetical protein